MSPTTDWIALARLASVALTIASVIAFVAWWRGALSRRSPAARLAAITALTLFLCFDLVVFGAFTRLTDSGLGCPDWPGCYGHASPIGAAQPIAQAEATSPDGPVTQTKAWIEMIHRYLAGTVGVLIIGMGGLAWRARATRPGALAWALATLAWVIVQGLFGQFTVTWKLYPAIVTAHLWLGMGLLALLALQHGMGREEGSAPRGDLPASASASSSTTAPRLRAAFAAAAVAMGVQIALGGWVSTNDALLACTGFPQCNGQWWPAMQWTQGFEILRPLGHRADGTRMDFPALVAIHWTHRLFAVVVVGALGGFAWALWREGAEGRRRAVWILGLLAAQVASGVANVTLSGPLVAALAHTAGAAGLVVCLCAWASAAWRASSSSPRRPAPAPHRALSAAASSPSP